ncbi:MAG: c-type cytochrome [Alkalilacustris sp.]
MRHTMIPAAALGLALAASAALADVRPAVEARQGQFKLYSFNLGPMAQMAQGVIDHDADLAAISAANLAALVSVDQGRLWPEGSDTDSIEGTRALPAIWGDLEDFASKFADLQAAVGDLEAVAGTDLDGLRGALGPVAAACSACHEAYRAPQ